MERPSARVCRIFSARALNSSYWARAACSPKSAICAPLLKSEEVYFCKSGRINTSANLYCVCVFFSIWMPTIWVKMEMGLFSPFFSAKPLDTSTTMSRSAPIDLTTSAGTLFTMPPSTKRCSPLSTGVNTPGTDMLARIASANEPRSSTTSSPVTISAATARNGIGRLSNS